MNNSIEVASETLAVLIESQFEDLIAAAEKVGASHAEWKPLDKGRTVLSQLQECAVHVERTVEALNGRSTGGAPTPEDLARFGSYDLAIAGCREGASALAAKLRTLTPADLQKTIENPFGVYSFTRLVMGTYWNASYHEGQIVYIGSLLDTPPA